MFGDYAFVALACGAISALIAKRQGRSALGWFVIGSATSVVGLFFALLLKKKIQKKA